MDIVLASKSPRRKEVLEQQGYDIIVDVSHVDEEAVKKEDVKDLVMELAKLKAKAVAERHQDSIVVGADTLVYFEGEQIGQQKDDTAAEAMLKRLMGKTHEVFSGICVINTATGEIMQDMEVSRVTLNTVPEEVLRNYIDSGQYKGKAGAYNIDDPEFESFVGAVEGCRLNIKGMPIEKIKMMIAALDRS